MRFTVVSAIECDLWDGWFVCAAPTHAQAKQIFWKSLKAMVPRKLVNYISESERMIQMVHGPKISVLGLDVTERIEGTPLDGIVLDEFANMKKSVWEEHVRGCLSTVDRPPGWAWFIGVPEGRNHYYKLCMDAKREDRPEWASFTWHSADIIHPQELMSVRNEMDPVIFAQEYEGSFVNFMGRAYYQFNLEKNASRRFEYDPGLPLIFCFDFNIAPGVCAIVQEQSTMTKQEEAKWRGEHPGKGLLPKSTVVIGEVHIPKGSNTVLVCNRLIQDWGHHEGAVYLYGDATGGNSGSAKLAGSDWDIIKRELHVAFPGMKMRVGKQNPRERARVNAVNSRFKSANGKHRLFIDPENAPRTAEDFDGVRVVEGGTGEIDKKDLELTHLSDAVGYYVERKFPVRKRRTSVVSV